jgi:hypothetical protein
MGDFRGPKIPWRASPMPPATKALQALAGAMAMTGAAMHVAAEPFMGLQLLHDPHAPGIRSTLTDAQRQRRHTRNTAQRKARKATRNHR